MFRSLSFGAFGLVSAVAAGLLGARVDAQTVIHSSSVRAFQVKTGPQTIVRGSNGHLYVIYRDQFTPPQNDIAIGRSTDNGATWDMNWQRNFAQLAATDVGALTPCIAIDGNDNLHCGWLHQTASVNRPPRTCRYNRYDAATQTWGTEVNLTPSAIFERPEPVIAVDAQNFVWVFHGTTGWDGTIVKSSQPYATGSSFSAITPSWTPPGSSQHADLIFDSLGRVHLTYYSTFPNGATAYHQWMDPGAASPAWSTTTPLGNQDSEADYFSSICADANGNIYAVYGNDVQAGKTADPEWLVRKWDGSTQTWGAAVSIYKVQRSVYLTTAGENDGRVFSAACDTVSGELYIVYRNFDNGNFVLARWHDGDTAHTIYANLANTGALASNHRNYFIFPQLRGSLNPVSNQTGLQLDMLYTVGDQTAPSPTYQLVYESFHVGSLTTHGTPKIGTSFPLNLTSVRDGGRSYTLAMSLTGTAPGIPVDRRFVPLVFDPLVLLTVQNLVPAIFQNFTGVFPAAGTASVQLNLPNTAGLVGIKLSGAFVTYPGGPAGIETISNPVSFAIVN